MRHFVCVRFNEKSARWQLCTISVTVVFFPIGFVEFTDCFLCHFNKFFLSFSSIGTEISSKNSMCRLKKVFQLKQTAHGHSNESSHKGEQINDNSLEIILKQAASWTQYGNRSKLNGNKNCERHTIQTH